MLQNLQKIISEFAKKHLKSARLSYSTSALVNISNNTSFENVEKWWIYLQRSVPIQPKWRGILQKKMATTLPLRSDPVERHLGPREDGELVERVAAELVEPALAVWRIAFARVVPELTGKFHAGEVEARQHLAATHLFIPSRLRRPHGASSQYAILEPRWLRIVKC